MFRPIQARRVAAVSFAVTAACLACSQSTPDVEAPSQGVASSSGAPSLAARAAVSKKIGSGPPPKATAHGTPDLMACLAGGPPASKTQTVGPLGGVIQFGGNSLTILPGALTAPVTITANAPADTVLVVNLQPEGLRFNVPAVLALDYDRCKLPAGSNYEVEYLNDALSLVLEIEPTSIQLSKHTIVGMISHFSKYGVGRSVYAVAE